MMLLADDDVVIKNRLVSFVIVIKKEEKGKQNKNRTHILIIEITHFFSTIYNFDQSQFLLFIRKKKSSAFQYLFYQSIKLIEEKKVSYRTRDNCYYLFLLLLLFIYRRYHHNTIDIDKSRI